MPTCTGPAHRCQEDTAAGDLSSERLEQAKEARRRAGSSAMSVLASREIGMAQVVKSTYLPFVHTHTSNTTQRDLVHRPATAHPAQTLTTYKPNLTVQHNQHIGKASRGEENHTDVGWPGGPLGGHSR